MNDRLVGLFSAFLERRLDEKGAAELLRAAEEDPAAADLFMNDLEMHRLLGLLHAPARQEERDADRILYYLRASSEATGFYARIRDRLRSGRTRPRRTRRALLGILGLGAAAALAVAFHSLRPASPAGKILSVEAPGIVLSRREEDLPARPGRELRPGDRISCREDGQGASRAAAAIRLEGGTEIDLAGGTLLGVLSGNSARLEKGRLYGVVSRPPFTLSTAAAELSVHGTRFEVFTDGRRTEVRLEEGRADLAGAGGRRRLGSLEECSAVAHEPPGPARPIRPEGIWRGRLGGGTGRALLGAGPAPCGIRFPPGSGIVDVRRDYGARGDGAADDTAALQRALDENLGRFRLLYLPDGVYRLTRPLTFGADRERAKQTVLQGQSREGTILRLDDGAPGFGDPSRPVPVLSLFEGTATAMAFANAVRDLTIDVGRGNPGAVGVRWMANNVGTMENVTIRSGDPEGAGAAGLDLTAEAPGPCLFRNVRIEGFETGIRASRGLFGVVFEHLTLRGQRSAGLYNEAEAITLRGLEFAGRGPAVVQADPAGVLFLMDAFLGGAGPAAILNRGRLHLRRVRQSGFSRLVEGAGGTGVESEAVVEYVSHPGPGVGRAGSLGLPVEEPPEVPWDPPDQWVVVEAAALLGQEDDAEILQEAVDRAAREGRGTVCIAGGLPEGAIRIGGTVRVPPGVRRILGMDGLIGVTEGMRRSGRPLFRVEGEGRDLLVLERFTVVAWAGGDFLWVEHDSPRPLLLRHLNSYGRMKPYRGRPGAVLFVEDVCAAPWTFTGQRVWMRQIDVETPGVGIVNEGGDLWILGLHGEGAGGTLVRTTGGGRTEIFGGLNRLSRRAPAAGRAPMFVVEEARASFSLAGSAPPGDPGCAVFLREVAGERVREVPVGAVDGGGRGPGGAFLGILSEAVR